MLIEGETLSLQYTIPVDGLTLSVAITEGGGNLYGSFVARNPTFITSDFATGGSGSFSHYVPSGSLDTLYVTLIATTPTTTFVLTATDGNNMTTAMGTLVCYCMLL